ncbi:MAG TPA: TetR/AcrR family transcriptional regulator [Acidimicrobiales bacterium]|jgi:AcrR family transcriptional regulator
MARRKASVEVTSLMATVIGPPDASDELAVRLLDAGAELLTEYGLRRWSMDDVAERAGVGRTSVYRKFLSRDDLVHAVLARELRQVFAAIIDTAARYDSVEDKIVEGALVALDAVDGSLVSALLTSDPTTFLPFLTTEAAPLLALGRELLVSSAIAAGSPIEPQLAAELAELVARLGISFIVTRQTVFPVDDPELARASLRRVLSPVLAPFELPG